MKNLRLFLSIVTCASLLVNTGAMAIADSTSTTLDGGAIEYQKLQARKYKDLQTELIYLLGRRVEEKDPGKLSSIGSKILANLKEFNTSLDQLSQLSQNQSMKQELLSLKTIISFNSLSDPVQVGKIQAGLGQKGGSKKFDRSTYQALKQKIEATGKKIGSPSPTIGSNPNPDKGKSHQSLPANSKQTSSDSSFWWVLPYLVSFGSAIASGLALFVVWQQQKKPQERGKNSLENELNSFKSDLDRKGEQLESQISTLSRKLNNLSHQVNTESLESSRKSASQRSTTNQNQERQIYPPNSRNSVIRESVPPPPPPRQSSLVNEYNRDPNAFRTKYSCQEVGEEQYNIEGRRSGQIKTVHLIPTERRRGGYWVLSQNQQQILVPSADLRVNEFNRDTAEAIFNYIDFNPSYRKIHLIQPAIVEMKSGSYQLVERGRIEFE